MNSRKILKGVYNRLHTHYGPQHWWPGETPFEVIVGAILTQNTNWTNVEKAIFNLKSKGLLDPNKLLDLHPGRLAALIKPAGYYNVKTKRLKNFLRYFVDRFEGEIGKMRRLSVDVLKEELLGVNGVGRETADSIILYALEKPIFVVDAYTYRIFSRHSFITEDLEYDELQSFFMDNLANDVPLFNEYHALLVRLGKEFCRPKPRCEECPLKSFL